MSQGIAQMMMDDPKLMRPDAHSVGPPMGVSIGIASLVIIIFSSSIALACCYCRDKFWLPRRSSPQPDIEQPPQRPDAAAKDSNCRHGDSLPVLMPGDLVPKFVALPCPREPPRAEKKVVEMQKAAAVTFSSVS